MKLYFPDITPPSYPFEEEPENTSITSSFEDGSMQSRIKFTRSRRSFTVSWKSLSRREYLILMDFIKNKAKFAANAFYWIVPTTFEAGYGLYDNPDQEELYVRIVNVGKWRTDELNYWSGTIEIKEV